MITKIEKLTECLRKETQKKINLREVWGKKKGGATILDPLNIHNRSEPTYNSFDKTVELTRRKEVQEKIDKCDSLVKYAKSEVELECKKAKDEAEQECKKKFKRSIRNGLYKTVERIRDVVYKKDRSSRRSQR